MRDDLPRLLVLCEQPAQRTTLSRALSADKGDVDVLPRGDIARVLDAPEVVWLADVGSLRFVAETAQFIRRRWPSVWFVATFADADAGAIPPMIASGVSDVIRAHASIEEIRVRLCAPRRWWTQATTKTHDWSEAHDLTRTPTWLALPHLFATELAAFTGMGAAEVTGEPPSNTVSVEIPVSLTRDALEVLVRVHLSTEAAVLLCQRMLAMTDVDSAAALDLAKEAANTLAGIFKRSAIDDDIEATIGMPRVVTEATPLTQAASTQMFRLADDDRLIVATEVLLKVRVNLKVAASTLREGMVIVSDLRAPGGALLVAGGTRLTGTSAQRLASHLGPAAYVVVAEAA